MLEKEKRKQQVASSFDYECMMYDWLEKKKKSKCYTWTTHSLSKSKWRTRIDDYCAISTECSDHRLENRTTILKKN